jgi:hypothetical protein
MITWEYFSKRRNIDLQDFIQKQEINTYEKLHAFCDGRSVIPPTKSQYDIAYRVAFPTVVEPKQKPKPKPKPNQPAADLAKPAKKKRNYARRKKPPVKDK